MKFSGEGFDRDRHARGVSAVDAIPIRDRPIGCRGDSEVQTGRPTRSDVEEEIAPGGAQN